jgi:hypothetical protein
VAEGASVKRQCGLRRVFQRRGEASTDMAAQGPSAIPLQPGSPPMSGRGLLALSGGFLCLWLTASLVKVKISEGKNFP